MPIQVLPQEVVSKIAAGEVIERPASAVKELVENSLDAGATQVSIEARDGGVGFIRVSDNGSGIAPDGLELLCQRHATSKISSVADLERISTLGFRGEALASIAAVAELDILTRTAAQTAGTFATFSRCSIVQRESRARVPGTTVTIRYLFRHFPARLKFLKSPATENGHISQLVSQYALAYPEVKFSLSLEGRLSFHTPGNGNLRDAVAEVYGVESARQMLEIKSDEAGVSVSGLTSPPSVFRSSRSYISFFINRRWVRSPLLVRAAEQAYSGWLTGDKHPIVIATVKVAPGDLDVNVHPRKTEVKFRQDPQVFAAMEKAIKMALGIAPVKPVSEGAVSAAAPAAAMVLPDLPAVTSAPVQRQELWQTQPDSNALPILRVVGQLSNSYVLAEGPDGLYLIDQHAAHERILYEKILSQVVDRKVEVQGLLEPAAITLNPRQEELLRNAGDLLSRFGFDIESFGPRGYLVRAVPAVVRGVDPARAITDLIDEFSAADGAPERENRVEQSLACHGAIKAGQPLSHDEMRELVRQLEQTRRPYTCPHGRPAIVHMNARQLEKQFGR